MLLVINHATACSACSACFLLVHPHSPSCSLCSTAHRQCPYTRISEDILCLSTSTSSSSGQHPPCSFLLKGPTGPLLANGRRRHRLAETPSFFPPITTSVHHQHHQHRTSPCILTTFVSLSRVSSRPSSWPSAVGDTAAPAGVSPASHRTSPRIHTPAPLHHPHALLPLFCSSQQVVHSQHLTTRSSNVSIRCNRSSFCSPTFFWPRAAPRLCYSPWLSLTPSMAL